MRKLRHKPRPTRRRFHWSITRPLREKGCACCGQLGDILIDHIIPIAAGGPDVAENLQGLCRFCNSRKGCRPITNEQLRKELNTVPAPSHGGPWSRW